MALSDAALPSNRRPASAQPSIDPVIGCTRSEDLVEELPGVSIEAE
jgi:hypothetical protein